VTESRRRFSHRVNKAGGRAQGAHSDNRP
jgi:hypothetical protein